MVAHTSVIPKDTESELGMVVYTCYPHNGETEAGRLQVGDHLGIHSEFKFRLTMSPKKESTHKMVENIFKLFN